MPMSSMMQPDPMFFPGYYPNYPGAGFQQQPQQQNPSRMERTRSDLVNQFDDEFDKVMNDYNMKMAKLQFMKNNLETQRNTDQPRYKPKPSKRFDRIKDLMDVVETETAPRSSHRKNNSFDYQSMNRRNFGDEVMRDRRNELDIGNNYGGDYKPNMYGGGRDSALSNHGGRKESYGGGYGNNNYNPNLYNNSNGNSNGYNPNNYGNSGRSNGGGLNNYDNFGRKNNYDSFGGVNISEFVMGNR